MLKTTRKFKKKTHQRIKNDVNANSVSESKYFFIHITNILIIKPEVSNTWLLETSKKQLYEILIITDVLVDFMERKEENVIGLANST